MTKAKWQNAMTPDRMDLQAYKRTFQDPEVAKKYHDDLTSTGSGSALSLRMMMNEIVTRAELSAIARMLRYIPPITRIADIPCGSGKERSLLSTRGRVIGIDASIPMLQFYARNGGSDGMCADIATIPLKTDSVDLVVCHRFLHRLPLETRLHLLTEIHRVSSQWAIVYYGVDGITQRSVMSLERMLGLGDRGRLFLCRPEEADNELRTTRWIVRRRTEVLKGVSTGYILLAEKS
ncbi:MAG: class I SAM-dependent methyltransferase [Candidatus Methylomirabilales bacterium]